LLNDQIQISEDPSLSLPEGSFENVFLSDEAEQLVHIILKMLF